MTLEARLTVFVRTRPILTNGFDCVLAVVMVMQSDQIQMWGFEVGLAPLATFRLPYHFWPASKSQFLGTFTKVGVRESNWHYRREHSTGEFDVLTCGKSSCRCARP